MFVKSPITIDLFKNKNPNLPLPLSPIVIHWGTWLSTVLYYADNLIVFKSVVDEVDKDDASLIEILQILLKY